MFQIMCHAKQPLSIAFSTASWEHQSEMPPHPDVDPQLKSSQNMSAALFKSLLPLNVYACLCEW